MECNLALDNALSIKCIITTISQCPRGTNIMKSGDFNTYLARPKGNNRDEKITSALAEAVLEDTLSHFLLHCNSWKWVRRTWSMVHLGREVRSWMDYLLSMDHFIFRKIYVQEPRHNLDHYMILGCLNSTRENCQYPRQRTRPPLNPQETPTREEQISTELYKMDPKPTT